MQQLGAVRTFVVIVWVTYGRPGVAQETFARIHAVPVCPTPIALLLLAVPATFPRDPYQTGSTLVRKPLQVGGGGLGGWFASFPVALVLSWHRVPAAPEHYASSHGRPDCQAPVPSRVA